MKKIYALLVAMIVVAAAFAQKGRGVQTRPVPHQFEFQKSLVAKHMKQSVAKQVLRAPEEEVQNYVRVNVDPEDWEGEYLIVYEDGGVAFNGGLAKNLDAASNTVAVTIEDGEIASSEAMDAASFAITAVEGGYAIQSKSGLYMGQTSDANGLLSNATTQYVNTLSIDNDGNAVILSSGGAYLRYNAAKDQTRFRYYKSSSYTVQKAIALYKKGGEKVEIVTPEAIVVPENLVVSEYKLTATGKSYEYEEADEEAEEDEENYILVESPYSSNVMIGIDGKDVYFKGLSTYLPDAWSKGTLSEDGKTVTIPADQYIGTTEVIDWSIFDYVEVGLYICAMNIQTQESEDIVLNYNAETNTFSTAQDILVFDEEGYGYDWYADVSMEMIEEFAATPATPSIVYFDNDEEAPNIEFDIPTTDTQNREMLTSKLFYVIYIEKGGQQQKLTLDASLYDNITKDMTEVPYTFNDDWDFVAGYMLYLNQGADEIASWTKIGIQTVYYGGGERHESEIGWMEIESGEYEDAINDVKAVRNAASECYDLQGRRISQPTRGLYIVNGRKVVIK